MKQEYEVITHGSLKHINLFLVRILSRAPHIHKDLELGLVLDGCVTIQTSTENQLLCPGDIYLLNPLEVHEFSADETGVLILSIQISPQFFSSFLTDMPNIRFLSSPNIRGYYADQVIQYKFLTMLCVELAYAYFSERMESTFQCVGLAAQIFHFLLQTLPSRAISHEDFLTMNRKFERVLSVTNYIEENFTRKLLLEEIAEREDLSLHYLSHLFKDTLGISFQEYLKEKRFAYALYLISTTQRNVLDISLSSGFSDARYLNRLFQERFGCTPKEFRNSGQKPQRRSVSSLQTLQTFFSMEESLQIVAQIRQEFLRENADMKLSELCTTEINQYLEQMC